MDTKKRLLSKRTLLLNRLSIYFLDFFFDFKRKELELKLKEAKKRKKEKFALKIKAMEEISEKEKNKWKNFNSKVKTIRFLKSVFRLKFIYYLFCLKKSTSYRPRRGRASSRRINLKRAKTTKTKLFGGEYIQTNLT